MSVTAQLEVSFPAISAEFYTPSYLDVTFPGIPSTFNAQGAFCSFDISFPVLRYYGFIGNVAELSVDFTPIESDLLGGNSLYTEFSAISFEATALTGITSSLGITFPDITSAFQCGIYFDEALPALTSTFTATTGRSARLIASFLPIISNFSVITNQAGRLEVTFSGIAFESASTQQVIAEMVANFPHIQSLFQAYPGEVGDLVVNFPAIVSASTAYSDLSADLISQFPSIKAFMEGSHSGRFDTSTEAQILATVLKYRRP